MYGLAPDRVGLADRELAFGGVHDQVDLVVLDHVHDVRTALAHLVHATARDARLFQHFRRAFGADQLEAVCR